jgi:hypothetical protein
MHGGIKGPATRTKRKLQLPPSIINAGQVREAVVSTIVHAKASGVVFGGISMKMMLRHAMRFANDNLPTVHIPELTPLIIADQFFNAMKLHDFEDVFIAGLRQAVREVEIRCAKFGDPTPMRDNPTKQWDRTTIWHHKSSGETMSVPSM